MKLRYVVAACQPASTGSITPVLAAAASLLNLAGAGHLPVRSYGTAFAYGVKEIPAMLGSIVTAKAAPAVPPYGRVGYHGKVWRRWAGLVPVSKSTDT